MRVYGRTPGANTLSSKESLKKIRSNDAQQERENSDACWLFDRLCKITIRRSIANGDEEKGERILKEPDLALLLIVISPLAVSSSS